jgi:hypothetical protein
LMMAERGATVLPETAQVVHHLPRQALPLQASGLRQSRGGCPGEVVAMPSLRGWSGRQALWRNALAMFVWPLSRSAPIARLRRVDIVRGPLPVRIWEASSVEVTSRGMHSDTPAARRIRSRVTR